MGTLNPRILYKLGVVKAGKSLSKLSQSVTRVGLELNGVIVIPVWFLWRSVTEITFFYLKTSLFMVKIIIACSNALRP